MGYGVLNTIIQSGVHMIKNWITLKVGYIILHLQFWIPPLILYFSRGSTINNILLICSITSLFTFNANKNFQRTTYSWYWQIKSVKPYNCFHFANQSQRHHPSSVVRTTQPDALISLIYIRGFQIDDCVFQSGLNFAIWSSNLAI